MREPLREDELVDSKEGELEERHREIDDCKGCIRRNDHNLPRGQGWRDVDHQSFDELTKRMKIDVLDFFGKLDPNAFEDWLTTTEDYFDRFAVLEDLKVQYVHMKLKAIHKRGVGV